MPNKKNPRVRNRPRNKANRLKLLENQNNQKEVIQQKQQHPQIELNGSKESDEDDDDMPELMDERTEANEQQNSSQTNVQQDPAQILQNLITSKLSKKDLKKEIPSETDLNYNNSNTKSANSTNSKLGKSKENSKENESAANEGEKTVFIQNLQKKMETMVANGDEHLPNTLMKNIKKMFDQGPVTDIETSDDEEEYIEYIYKPRKYFLVALCNLCKIDLCKFSQSIECSTCHMTYYCSLEHMQNDAEHQQLCCALQQMAKKSCDGHIFKNCSTMTADNFRSYRIVSIRKVECILKRPLNATEQEVILFPRLCNNIHCREYQFDKLHDCSECGMIAYCLEHPEHMNPAEHSKWCKSYKLFKELVQFQEQFGRLDPTLPTKILKELPIACLNTKQVFNKLGYDLPESSCEYANLTQISTGPLTAWYALKLADQLKNPESLNIHLIGAEIEFEVDVLHKWELFFLHITPSVINLKIVFVGPELNPHNISFEQLQKTKCCSVCRKSNRTVQYFFESYTYHDYCGSSRFLAPNLICFFNAGLYRCTGYNMEDTWPESIVAASNLNVPIIVTAYTEYECPLDLNRFIEESQRKLRIIQPPTQNPFASVKPERNFISDEEAPLMFKNYYCFVVE